MNTPRLFSRFQTSVSRLFSTGMLILTTFYSASLFAGPSQDSALVSVVVTNFDNQPKKGEQILFEGESTGSSYLGISGADGTFDIMLATGETYLIKIKGVGSTRDYNRIEIPVPGENEYYGTIMLTIQFEQPRIFTLNNVEFEFGKSTLTPGSYPELQELLDYMKLKDDIKVEIAGHTDDVGSEEFNMTLSEARANTVRNYLISNGISPDRIRAEGYGETQPIAPNTSEEGCQRNRRTEVRVETEGGGV